MRKSILLFIFLSIPIIFLIINNQKFYYSINGFEFANSEELIIKSENNFAIPTKLKAQYEIAKVNNPNIRIYIEGMVQKDTGIITGSSYPVYKCIEIFKEDDCINVQLFREGSSKVVNMRFVEYIDSDEENILNNLDQIDTDAPYLSLRSGVRLLDYQMGNWFPHYFETLLGFNYVNILISIEPEDQKDEERLITEALDIIVKLRNAVKKYDSMDTFFIQKNIDKLYTKKF
jgi:hypothetical protein